MRNFHDASRCGFNGIGLCTDAELNNNPLGSLLTTVIDLSDSRIILSLKTRSYHGLLRLPQQIWFPNFAFLHAYTHLGAPDCPFLVKKRISIFRVGSFYFGRQNWKVKDQKPKSTAKAKATSTCCLHGPVQCIWTWMQPLFMAPCMVW
jgi:hypothetical protein